MNISEQYRENLISCIRNPGTATDDLNIKYDNQGVFNHILQFKINTKESFELPIYNRFNCETKVLVYIDKYDNNEDFISNINILQPLPVNSQILSFKSAAPFIKRGFTLKYSPYGVMKSVIQDNIYYITKGIILDKDFNILLIGTITYDKNTNNNFKVSKSNLYVSPKVFINIDKPIEKHIVNKLLPTYYSNGPLSYIVARNGIENSRDVPINVEIKDLDYLIISPSAPSFDENINTNINKFLLTNLNTFE